MDPPGGVFGFTGEVDATPLLAFTGGALAFPTPVVVTNMTAPVGQVLTLGEASFDGPVSVTVGGPVPMPVDPVSGLLQINGFSVMGGAQTDDLLVADDSHVWLQAGAGGTRLYGRDLVLRSLPSEGGVPSDPRPGTMETWMRAGQSGAYFHGDVTIGGTLLGPSGAYQTMGDTGPTGADSTVPGPAGPTGADSTVAGPTGATGPAGILTVSTTPGATADPDQNIIATLASQALSIDYTSLFNKLATYVTSSSLTSTLASYLTTSAAASDYQAKFLIGARLMFTGSGVLTNVFSFGRTTITTANVSRSGVGVYHIDGITVGNGAMAFGGTGFTSITTGNRVATSFPTFNRLTVFLYNAAGTLVDGDAAVFTIP